MCCVEFCLISFCLNGGFLYPEPSDSHEAEKNTFTNQIVNVLARIGSRPLLLQRGRFNISTMTAHLEFVNAPSFETTRVIEEPLSIMGIPNVIVNEIPPSEEMEINNPGPSVGTEPRSGVSSVQIGVQNLNIRPRRREKHSAVYREKWISKAPKYAQFYNR